MRDTLVILSPAFPANETETNWIPFLQLLIKSLQREAPALSVIVISFSYPVNKSGYFWNGVEVIPFGGFNTGKLSRMLLWLRVWKKLNAIRRKRKILSLLSIWCGECALVGSWYGKIFRVPHYCWICGQDARKTNGLVKKIRPAPDELIAMSPFLVREFQRNHGIEPAYMMPNAIDPSMFKPAASIRKDIDILGAGSLSPLKQYDILVDVVDRVKKDDPSVSAYLCGGGEEFEKLQAKVRSLRLENNLQLVGEKSHDEVIAFMERTKVFLHPSSYEGFGAVCIEALYAGAHVVSFIDPVQKPIKNWHIVQSKEEMAEKTREILEDPSTKYDPVLVYTMDANAKFLMGLFGYQSAKGSLMEGS